MPFWGGRSPVAAAAAAARFSTTESDRRSQLLAPLRDLRHRTAPLRDPRHRTAPHRTATHPHPPPPYHSAAPGTAPRCLARPRTALGVQRGLSLPRGKALVRAVSAVSPCPPLCRLLPEKLGPQEKKKIIHGIALGHG